MSLHEQISFLKSIVPFDKLDPYELDTLSRNLDIVYFKKNEVVFTPDQKVPTLYFIIKGLVQEIHEEEIVSVFSKEEYFSAIDLIENHTKNQFVAIEESICYALPREEFLAIMYENKHLERYFFQSISQKLNNNLEIDNSKEFSNFMISRVKEAYLQKPVIVDDTVSIYDAVIELKRHKASSLLVRSGDDQLGIVTDTDFREKIILNRLSFDEPISAIATYGLKTVSSEEFLFNAQLKMNKHGIKRLIVEDETTQSIIGVLDLISLTSFFASHTYSVILELDNAQSLEELKLASKKFVRVIRILFAKGVKVRYISKIIGQLNNKLFTKLFSLLAPSELQEQSALIVMGSEGRAEQILRTDQDNALILSNDCTVSKEVIDQFTQAYTHHLVDFGFPRCQGNIMVSNPYWAKSQSEFETTIFNWVNNPDGESFMNLAIFYDAFCVAGDKNLLLELKRYLNNVSTSSQTFHSHFAKAVLQFETPLSLFSNFIVDKNEHKDELDIKKGGIFPIVHGIRALALEQHLNKTTTVERIKVLNDKEIIDKEFASELIESFNFLLTLRLKFRLEKIDARKPLDNYINPNKLNSLEKDLLRDSFKIVDKFKKFITYHYKLNQLG
jgi:CBS domain-containing protein